MNIFNFTVDGWWFNPATTQEYNKIIPNWWVSIYPITYYYIGCYLNEFKIVIKRSKNLIFLLLSIFLFGTFNFYRSYGEMFISGPWQDWGALPNVVMTTLLFILLVYIDFSKLSENKKKVLEYTSELCLGAYLVSSIFDSIFYPLLNDNVLEVTIRLNYYVLIVPIVFICSLILSLILNVIYKYMNKLFS